MVALQEAVIPMQRSICTTASLERIFNVLQSYNINTVMKVVFIFLFMLKYKQYAFVLCTTWSSISLPCKRHCFSKVISKEFQFGHSWVFFPAQDNPVHIFYKPAYQDKWSFILSSWQQHFLHFAFALRRKSCNGSYLRYLTDTEVRLLSYIIVWSSLQWSIWNLTKHLRCLFFPFTIS